MTVVSIFQSKFSQASSGPQTAQQAQQKKMMLLMPVMFLFLFWNMPSGLVLYWTVQNILSIGEQWFINRKFDAQLAAAN
jgi:YidC/Oxa1 family membrane protein insertase